MVRAAFRPATFGVETMNPELHLPSRTARPLFEDADDFDIELVEGQTDPRCVWWPRRFDLEEGDE
jgi:hypothetical protein